MSIDAETKKEIQSVVTSVVSNVMSGASEANDKVISVIAEQVRTNGNILNATQSTQAAIEKMAASVESMARSLQNGLSSSIKKTEAVAVSISDEFTRETGAVPTLKVAIDGLQSGVKSTIKGL